MTEGNQLYKKYQGLIRSTSKHYADTYGVPFEDIQSEANELYCRALLSFDAEKGCEFSTHLCITFKRLHQICKNIQADFYGVNSLDEIIPETLLKGDPQVFKDAIPAPPTVDCIIFQEAIKELSPEPRKLVKALIAGDAVISKKRKIKLSINSIMRELKCGEHKARHYHAEISRWWSDIKCYA